MQALNDVQTVDAEGHSEVAGDTILLNSAAEGANVDLEAGSLQLGDKTIQVLNFENVTGSAYDDEITGGDGANVIEGGAGDDRLEGGSGADTVAGGEGDDILRGWSDTGQSVYQGGAGNEIIVSAAREAGMVSDGNYIEGIWSDHVINGGSGDDDLFAERIMGVNRDVIFGRGWALAARGWGRDGCGGVPGWVYTRADDTPSPALPWPRELYSGRTASIIAEWYFPVFS